MQNKISVEDKIKWLEDKKFKHFGMKTYTYTDLPDRKNNKKFCYENLAQIEQIKNIVLHPKKIEKHQFYPFIAIEIVERKFGKHKQTIDKLTRLKNTLISALPLEKDEIQTQIDKIENNFAEPLIKSRPIKYASHLDGHIYSYYASEILLPAYERKIQEHNLNDEILAYRTVPQIQDGDPPHSRSNNITMAKEVFQQVIDRECNCVALAYDLKSFFDTIDHKKLKEQWCKVLEVEKLPPDHFNIYKSLTKYCYVDFKTICKYFNYEEYCTSEEHRPWAGNCEKCRTPKKNKLPRILFGSAKEFREFRKSCDEGEFKKNEGLKDEKNPYGIPQGSALSSVLSNIYLLDFDIRVKNFLESKDAVYRRYCDDILIICSRNDRESINVFIQGEILKSGKHLRIHEIDDNDKYSKSQVYDFTNKEKIKQFPLQYLGFCFDGKTVEIRSSSLNRYWRKAHNGIIASKLNVLTKLQKMYDAKIEIQDKHAKMFRRKIYERYTYLGKNNFLSYVDRAFSGMSGIDNHKIKSQIKGHLKKIKNELAICDIQIKEKIDKLKKES